MEFCKICNNKLLMINSKLKCKYCDDIQEISKNQNVENKINSSTFPFFLNQYYSQKNIRQTLSCHSIHGINFNKEKNFFVLLRNAHKFQLNQKNVYLDKFDDKTGFYHYVGMGTTENQNLVGLNLKLSCSSVNNQEIHLFWQYAVNSDHKYLGKVSVIDTQEIIQPDKNGKNRKVLNFILKPET